MSSRTKIWSLAAPLLLALMVATIAAAVNRFAAPMPEPQFASDAEYDRDMSRVRTGSESYPREAFDLDGVRVEIPHPAQRIVSQSRSIEELLYSVVPPSSVVGVSASAYDPSTSDIYAVVEQYRPAVASDLERTIRLNPDLIVVSSSGRADLSTLLRTTGIPVYRMFTMFTTLDQVADSIRLTGYLTGQDDAAREREQQFRAQVNDAIALRPAGAPKPRILALSMGIAYGRKTLFNDIVEKLGGVNVGAEGGLEGYDEVNSETVLKWNPEWIVTGSEPGKEEEARARLLNDPAIALTKAARNGHILVFDNRVFLPVSPVSAKLANELARELYAASKAGGHS